jgi:hypothetical protein
MLRSIVLGCVGVFFIGASHASQPNPQSEAPTPSSIAAHGEFLDQYCIGCHSASQATAGLTLEDANLEDIGAAAPTWEKVVHKLRTGTMPPPGMPRPDQRTYDSFATYLETSLDREALNSPNPGDPSIRRLNRTEYTNAIRDLLALDVDGAALLPVDEVSEGFDNVGDALSVSPVLLERYMAAARRISRLAIGDPATPSYLETYEAPHLLMQDERMGEDLPFGSRGGLAIRHHFPTDGEYSIRIALQRNARNYIRGLADAHQLDVRLDGARITLFTVGGEQLGQSGPPYSQAGLIGDPLQEEYEGGGAEAHLEVRFPAKAGPALLAVTFLDQTSVPELLNGINMFQRMTQFDAVQYKGGNPAVDTVTIGGPFDATGVGDTPSRGKIFVCRPARVEDETACAEEILSALARRAYRRPVTDEDIETLLDFYSLGRREGTFDDGIGAALERILVGPEFLFRTERDTAAVGPNTVHNISDLDLASRLSFFLWSSIPDDALLEAADSGRLKDPEQLEQQVARMLADPRSKALVNNFASQWLYLRNLQSATPDPKLFPFFDENLREAFRQETELFIESQLREDRTVRDLLNADYTFLNEQLASHYGIGNVYGSHFRRVALDDRTRGGLLGQGSILAVTSYANRTSVVLRGKWLLENILGAPPPAPPADVPALEEAVGDGGAALPLREMMEQHRANPSCMACHLQMDALGFALENFDPIGQWRTTDADTPIDASAELPDGTAFEGPDGLRRVLLDQPEALAHTITEKLFVYALGRGLEYYDLPAVRQVVREAAADDYRWSDLISGVVRSAPFQMRRSE